MRQSTEYYDTIRHTAARSQLPAVARLIVVTVCSGFQVENELGGPPFNPTLNVIQHRTGLARSTAVEYVSALEQAGWFNRSTRPWTVKIGDPTCRRREKIPAEVRAEVGQRHGEACRRCGATSDLTIDHIHPWSKGGTDDVGNLQLLCRSCNSNKGARI